MTRTEFQKAIAAIIERVDTNSDQEVLLGAGILCALMGSLCDGSLKQLSDLAHSHSERQLVILTASPAAHLPASH